MLSDSRTFQRPPPKKLGRPTIQAKGGEGDWSIEFFLVYEDGAAASAVPVHFTVAPQGERLEHLDLNSDAEGFAGCRLKFGVASCDATIEIRGLGEPLALKNLSGPPPAPRPLERFRLKPDPHELAGSWWEVTKRAWRKPVEIRSALRDPYPDKTEVTKMERRPT